MNEEIVIRDLAGNEAPLFYILDADKNIIPVRTTAEKMAYYRWYENHQNRRVARTEHNNVSVSTVFLGVDHGLMEDGPPVVFESMVFGGPMDQHQDRYCTWDEAMKGHVELCRKVFGSSVST